jgi:predicted nucleic acid-binding protein
MYLLDTNVISELRKAASGKADRKVIAWAASVSTTSLFLSVVSILELELGVLLIERKDPTQGAVLRAWLDKRVLPAFDNRILPVDTAVAQRCARLHIPDPRADRDALIAATALEYNLAVVTRNAADFRNTNLQVIDPWETD